MNRKIKIRRAGYHKCWCAVHVDNDGWEVALLATGCGLEELIRLLRPGPATIIIPEHEKPHGE